MNEERETKTMLEVIEEIMKRMEKELRPHMIVITEVVSEQSVCKCLVEGEIWLLINPEDWHQYQEKQPRRPYPARVQWMMLTFAGVPVAEDDALGEEILRCAIMGSGRQA